MKSIKISRTQENNKDIKELESCNMRIKLKKKLFNSSKSSKCKHWVLKKRFFQNEPEVSMDQPCHWMGTMNPKVIIY